jgi:hypothetical protein
VTVKISLLLVAHSRSQLSNPLSNESQQPLRAEVDGRVANLEESPQIPDRPEGLYQRFFGLDCLQIHPGEDLAENLLPNTGSVDRDGLLDFASIVEVTKF